MKASAFAFALLVACAQGSATAGTASPVQKVVQLLSELEAKITAEGTEAHKTYVAFAEFCEDRSRELRFEIKTGTGNAQALSATIEEETSLTASATARVEKLAGEITTDEADLKAATEIREAEAAAFAAQEKELTEVIDTLGRAGTIIEREMQKGSASMMQMKNANDIVKVAAMMVEAMQITSADAARLTALVQSRQESTEGDAGAPAGDVYASQSGGILGTLTSLREEAETQLADSRSKETANTNNYQLLRQSMEDEIKFGNKDMSSAKKSIAGSTLKKATATGDLEVTSSDLKESNNALGKLHQECMAAASSYEAATKSRTSELEALATARKVILENTGSAGALTYGLDQVSLLQLTQVADLHQFEAVRFLREFALKNGGTALAQLAQQASADAAEGDDVFAKVKGLISNMIEKLEDEAGVDATHKAFCDKELAESYEKKADKDSEIAKLTNSIDQMSARSAQLKEQVAQLQKELAGIVAAQAEMDKIRAQEDADYKVNRADLEQGLGAVKSALKTLTEYYAQSNDDHAQAQGAGEGIIGLLQVVESDFSAGLSDTIAVEESAARQYDTNTKENQIATASKDQDVKYKNKESAQLDKATTEDTSDRAGVQAELDAILKYLKELHGQCDEVAETYAEKKGRREAELAGLKQALEILEGESSLIQKKTFRRGVRSHM